MESLHVYADNLNTTANHISTSDRVLLFVNFDKRIEFFFSYLRRLDVRFVASMCACIKVMKILNSLTASINRRWPKFVKLLKWYFWYFIFVIERMYLSKRLHIEIKVFNEILHGLYTQNYEPHAVSKRRLSGNHIKYNDIELANADNLQILAGTKELQDSFVGWEHVLIEKQMLASALDQMSRHSAFCPHNNLLHGIRSDPYGNIKLSCK